VNSQLLLLINAIATWYMVGLIWLIQIVHYPLFGWVGRETFIDYERNHSNWITPIVGVPMLIELVTAALLCLNGPSGIPRWLFVLGLGMVVAIWLSTALIQVPCHSQLSNGFDDSVHRWLVWSNWIRTLLWSLRGGLMGYAIWIILRPSS
jgi:hypothetical protein